MRYTIYKVTNLLNGKFYIGKHQTDNPTDSYMGSGRAILNAIKLHGKQNFVKEILFDFDSEEEMNNKERELVNENLVSNRLSYNMTVGGEGGPHFKGRSHSEETKQKISDLRKNLILRPEARQKLSERRHSDETKQKISDAARKRIRSEETKQKIAESLRKHYEANPRSEETKGKISKTMKINHRFRDKI